MPELSEVDLVTAAAIFALGLLAGALLTRLVLPSRRKLRQLVTALDQARTEHQTYRAEVSEHFEKTSELVASMTASYKAVYDHLATGARTLCSENAALGAGRFAAPRLVLDQEVDVERLTGNDATVAATHADGPVLEMTRETKAPPANEAARAPASASAADNGASGADPEDGRSPLH